MALNTLKCNHLTPLHFKWLTNSQIALTIAVSFKTSVVTAGQKGPSTVSLLTGTAVYSTSPNTSGIIRIRLDFNNFLTKLL